MKQTTNQKTAKKLTKEIFDALKKYAIQHNVTVGTMQSRFERAKIQIIKGQVFFTHFHHIGISRNCQEDDNICLWYNRAFKRQEIYNQVLYFLNNSTTLK